MKRYLLLLLALILVPTFVEALEPDPGDWITLENPDYAPGSYIDIASSPASITIEFFAKLSPRITILLEHELTTEAKTHTALVLHTETDLFHATYTRENETSSSFAATDSQSDSSLGDIEGATYYWKITCDSGVTIQIGSLDDAQVFTAAATLTNTLDHQGTLSHYTGYSIYGHNIDGQGSSEATWLTVTPHTPHPTIPGPPFSLDRFHTSVTTYKENMSSMSTGDLNALTLSSLRTYFGTDLESVDTQNQTDPYLNEILAFRDGLVATPPDLTWVTIDGEPSTNKKATLGTRTFYYRPHTQFIHTGVAATSSGALSCTMPGAPNYHWHYDLANGSPLSSDMSSFISGGCSAIDCGTETYNYGYNLLHQDYQWSVRWGHEEWTANNVTPHQRTSMAWHYDPETLTWWKGVRHHGSGNVAGGSLYEIIFDNAANAQFRYRQWTYNPTTKVWANTTWDGSDTEASDYQTVEWKYDDATQRWTNLSYGEVWEHTDPHLWQRLEASEDRWYNHHGNNPGYLINIDASPNITGAGNFVAQHSGANMTGFFSLGDSTWYEQQEAKTVNPLAMADRNAGYSTRISDSVWVGGLGGKRGYFRRKDGILNATPYTETYFYDKDGIWNRTSGSAGPVATKYLPFLPPLPVVQHQEIITAFESLVTEGLWAAIPSSLTWTILGSSTYSGKVAKQRWYRYKADATYTTSSDLSALSGHFTGTTPQAKWALDTTDGSPLSNVALGAFTFLTSSYAAQRWSIMTTKFTPAKPRDTIYGFVFDKETQSFAPTDWADGAGSAARKALAVWDYDAATKTWTNQGTTESWAYNTETKRWSSIIPGYDGADSLVQEWSFNHDTKVWTNHTLSESWTAYSPMHMSNGITHWYNHGFSGVVWETQKTESGFSAVHFIPSTTPGYFYRYIEWPRSESFDYRTMFQNNSISDPSAGYRYRGPSGGNVRGTWELDSLGTTYSSYDPVTDMWDHPTLDTQATFFHHIPPLPVSIHQDMISAYDSLNAAGYADTIIEAAEPVEWTANSRNYAHHNRIEYNTTENTAPLKITTADTQLLHDLTQNPNFTQVGKWQWKDITNNHTWQFNPSSGEWSNIATGHTWKYSKNEAVAWYQETIENSWIFDENSQSWAQTMTESE